MRCISSPPPWQRSSAGLWHGGSTTRWKTDSSRAICRGAVQMEGSGENCRPGIGPVLMKKPHPLLAIEAGYQADCLPSGVYHYAVRRVLRYDG